MATHWQIGDKIQNRWEIHNILRGGMGIVYIVYDHHQREPLAAKTFQDEIFARQPRVADLFIREAHVWINLGVHENIAQARFVDTIEGKPLLFLQYVSGGDLSSWIGKPLLTKDLPQVLRFAIQFCYGMEYAYSKGIRAHRDIKPSNCLITGSGTLKVTDFGLARVPAMQEREGGPCGTYEYRPPEQWDKCERADERSDIYSFGATLYEVLTGRPPFGTRRQVSISELERRAKEELPPPLESQHSILEPIVQICLAKDPERRFASFGEVRSRLAGICESLTGKPVPKPVPLIMGIELETALLNNQGASLYELRLYGEALACYDRALKINPDHAEALINKGHALRSLRQYDEAIACINYVLELNPLLEQAWDCKGSVLDEMGRLEEAIECFDRAIRINPQCAVAWYNKGLTLHNLKRHEEGLTCYDEFLKLSPRNEQGWTNMGIALEEVGRREAALDCFEHALEINPRLEEALYQKARVLDLLGRHAEALPYFNKAIALKQNDDLNWYGKGVALTKLGRCEDAIYCYDRVIAINPEFEKAWVNKGSALLALKRYQDAIFCLDCALAVNRRNGGTWHNKGLALAAIRRITEALACFEEAQRLGHPRAEQAIAMCQQMLGE